MNRSRRWSVATCCFRCVSQLLNTNLYPAIYCGGDHCFGLTGGAGGIRTHGGFRPHRFSGPDLSTAQTPHHVLYYWGIILCKKIVILLLTHYSIQKNNWFPYIPIVSFYADCVNSFSKNFSKKFWQFAWRILSLRKLIYCSSDFVNFTFGNLAAPDARQDPNLVFNGTTPP